MESIIIDYPRTVDGQKRERCMVSRVPVVGEAICLHYEDDLERTFRVRDVCHIAGAASGNPGAIVTL